MRAIDIKEDKEVEETDKKRKWERVLVKEFEDNLSLFISKVKHHHYLHNFSDKNICFQ